MVSWISRLWIEVRQDSLEKQDYVAEAHYLVVTRKEGWREL